MWLRKQVFKDIYPFILCSYPFNICNKCIVCKERKTCLANEKNNIGNMNEQRWQGKIHKDSWRRFPSANIIREMSKITFSKLWPLSKPDLQPPSPTATTHPNLCHLFCFIVSISCLRHSQPNCQVWTS